jgi:hypothetical protein
MSENVERRDFRAVEARAASRLGAPERNVLAVQQ